MKQFDRQVNITVGGVNIEGLDIDFSIEFSDSPEPNIHEITVWNMETPVKKGDRVILNAGYKGDIGVLCNGFIEDYEIFQGADREVVLYVGEVVPPYQKDIKIAYSPGVKADFVMRDLLSRYGYQIGDFQIFKNISYPYGFAVDGSISEAVERIAKDTESQFYMRKDRLFTKPPKKGYSSGFLLNPDTGLLNSPERMQVNDKQGWRVLALMNHRIDVDSIIQVDSRLVNGTFRVIRGRHTSDFQTEMEVLPYG